MTRFISYGMLCLSAALPRSVPTFSRALSTRDLSPQTPPENNGGLFPAIVVADADETNSSALVDTNTTDSANLTNTTDNSTAPESVPVPTQPPTPAVAPSSPTPPPTSHPTKKYHPPPGDGGEEEGKKGPTLWKIALWIVLVFSLIWALCYFRVAIYFFFGNLINNTQRFGCKGCLVSCLPCIFGSQLGGSSEPMLDQIIFESEEPNAPFIQP